MASREIAFIKCYERNRAFWDVDYEHFCNYDEMAIGYNELLLILRQSDSSATISDVKKRISTIRDSYRREILKVRKSQSANAKGRGRVYYPTLWYYHLLGFLNPNSKPQEVWLESEPVLNDSAEKETMEHDPAKEESVVRVSLMEPQCNALMQEQPNKNSTKYDLSAESNDDDYLIPRPAKRRISTKSDEIFAKLKGILNKEPDHCDSLAKSWASKLRAMPTAQSRILEKLINHTLLRAEMETLKMNMIQKC